MDTTTGLLGGTTVKVSMKVSQITAYMGTSDIGKPVIRARRVVWPYMGITYAHMTIYGYTVRSYDHIWV